MGDKDIKKIDKLMDRSNLIAGIVVDGISDLAEILYDEAKVRNMSLKTRVKRSKKNKLTLVATIEIPIGKVNIPKK